MPDETVWRTMLFDFYGDLLTDKQREYYDLHYNQDLSLAEIAAFPLILLERKASSRLYLEKYFLQNGQRLHPEIELGARSLLVDLAAIGLSLIHISEPTRRS